MIELNFVHYYKSAMLWKSRHFFNQKNNTIMGKKDKKKDSKKKDKKKKNSKKGKKK